MGGNFENDKVHLHGEFYEGTESVPDLEDATHGLTVSADPAVTLSEIYAWRSPETERNLRQVIMQRERARRAAAERIKIVYPVVPDIPIPTVELEGINTAQIMLYALMCATVIKFIW